MVCEKFQKLREIVRTNEAVTILPLTWDTSKPRSWHTYRGAKRLAHFRNVRMHNTWRITHSLQRKITKMVNEKNEISSEN